MGASGSQSGSHTQAPLLIRWGGNAELAAMHVRTPFKDLVAKGHVRAIFVDYRGFGWSEGVPTIRTLRSDAVAFYTALPQLLTARNVSWPLGAPIVLMGRSIGSLCALHVALLHSHGIDSLILDSPVACHWPL